MDMVFNWMRVVNNFVVDDLWLGKLEDDHSSGHDNREKSKGHCFPCFQGDQSEGERNKNCGLEFQAQQKWNHNFLDEAATCGKYNF